MKRLFIFTFLCVISAFPRHSIAQSILQTQTLSGLIFDSQKMSDEIVVVNFWAQWCPNCIAEMEVLEELYREHHAHGLEIIGVSVDPKKDLPKVLQRIAKVSYQNSMLIDAIKNNFPEINALPTTYILYKNGATQKELIVRGNANKEYFEEVLQPLLRR